MKNLGICVFNSGWVSECFGQAALDAIRHLPVLCSGSTLGSYPAIRKYLTTMLTSMDEVKCWARKRIESDQGYQNYLYYNGHFNTPEGNATVNPQGVGVVNTIGALNGYRVPKELKGPLDTHWKIRDKQGYILNNDGTRSACIHQWDRWESDLIGFVDSGVLYDKQLGVHVKTPSLSKRVAVATLKSNLPAVTVGKSKHQGTSPFSAYASVPIVPVLGAYPTNGIQPLYGKKHQGGDAVFALACKYPKYNFQRFVGSLRKFNYDGDIVLAVSPPNEMRPGVNAYLEKMNVLAYPFGVVCDGKDNCRLKDEFLGYPDPRPYRSFANIRYALYEYWMRHYSDQSYILILDFRDTFFQANPFAGFGYPISSRVPKYDLQVYAENYKVSNTAY